MVALTSNTRLLKLLAYPSQDEAIIQSRILELQSLGIQMLLEGGNISVRGQSILGKGYRGVVILAKGLDADHACLTLALKVRRVDGHSSSFQAEAEALAIANTLNIGPQLYVHSENFMAMEYLEGPTIAKWLKNTATNESVRQVLGELLRQCYRLDQVGLDHGDLRCITEHVIFRDQMPVIIDFSGSSCDRRPSNVTTIIQGFFWGTVLPNFIAQYFPIPDKEMIIPLLSQYKRQRDATTFLQILALLQLS